MLDLETPTVVTILDVKQLGSIDPECPSTVVLSVVAENGIKCKIYMHNNSHQTPLASGAHIVVQEQKSPKNNMAREYKVWRSVHAYKAMAKQNIQ